MSVPFLSVNPHSFKLKVAIRFPAATNGGVAIDVFKTNGTYTINWDLSELVQTTSIADQANSFFGYYNANTNIYNRIRIGDLLAGAVVLPDPAWTIRGNKTGVTALATGFTIDSLSNKFTPVNTDRLMVQDSADGSLKNILWSSLPGVGATPFDALAYNGLQLNGGMEVSQEYGLNIGTAANRYFCDSWLTYTAGTMVISSFVNPTNSFPGFSAAAITTVQTAQTTMGAGDYCILAASIEGYRIARLGWGTANAQPITISFWTAHHRTGTYTGVICSRSNRSFAFSYVQNIADVAEYKTITIPGETTGTWNITNGLGLQVIFAMACGATNIAPALNTWYSANYFAGPGQINAVAATSDIFRFTGLVVLPGTEAPTAARSAFIMRPYDQELVTCMRYFWKCANEPLGWAITGQLVTGNLAFRPPMRTAPTLLGGASFAVAPGSAGTPAVGAMTATGVKLFNGPSGWTVGADVNFSGSFDARL